MGAAWRRWRAFCGPGLAPVLYPLAAVAAAVWLTGPLENWLAAQGAPVDERWAWGWLLARAGAALLALAAMGGLLWLRARARESAERHAEEARQEREGR